MTKRSRSIADWISTEEEEEEQEEEEEEEEELQPQQGVGGNRRSRPIMQQLLREQHEEIYEQVQEELQELQEELQEQQQQQQRLEQHVHDLNTAAGSAEAVAQAAQKCNEDCEQWQQQQPQTMELREKWEKSVTPDGSDDDSPLLVVVSPWELERCSCEEDRSRVRPDAAFKLAVAGEDRCRCWECLKPLADGSNPRQFISNRRAG